MQQTLNGSWLLRQCGSNNEYPATVPGCNFLDLLDNGIIENPFIGTNEKDVQWVADCDWEYTRTFFVGKAALSCRKIELVCKMLDTVCEVYINNSSVGSAKNCHIIHTFDVTKALVSGENSIRIVFRSPKKYVEEKVKKTPAPVNSNGQNGIVHLRKPQYHFGWDWGPVLTPSGISDDIYLDFINGKRLGELHIEQQHENGTVTLQVSAENATQLTVAYPNGEGQTVRSDTAVFTIEQPELWWTKELSGKEEQPLYCVTAAIIEGDTVDDCISKFIGLRTLTLNRGKDKYGYNFQFVLNGVPVFIKGANYIPPDSFMNRFDEERLNRLLDAVQFSNMNLLRIWGGGFYGSDALYNECDRRGIMLWQDFMFACQAYPFFDNDFLAEVMEEVRRNVSRLSHHPSLAVWCGNNEIEDMHMSWLPMKQYIEWTEKFFYHILPEEIRKYDRLTPYTQGSPIGTAHNKNVSADFVGDTHLWGVWHGLQPMKYYRRRMTRFCSEFGFESLPDFKTVQAYAKPQEYALSSDVQKAHQKCQNGNDKMIYYMASRFRLPKDIRDIIYLSQVTQQECIADATEHWRRNKGRCNGAVYWQLNDCWPVCSWSSYDYYGNYKALQYKARWFNAPLSVSLEDSEKQVAIYVLNDLKEAQSVTAEYEIFDFVKGTVKKESDAITVGAVENQKLFTIPLDGISKETQGIAARLYQNGRLLMQKTVLLLPEKQLKLLQAPIEMQAEIENNQLLIHLKSPVFARLVKLENASSQPFSDNYFDLLPQEERIITQPLDISCDQLNTLTVESIGDVKAGYSALHDQMKRIKVFFSPTNIANAVYHGKVPKDEHPQ